MKSKYLYIIFFSLLLITSCAPKQKLIVREKEPCQPTETLSTISSHGIDNTSDPNHDPLSPSSSTHIISQPQTLADSLIAYAERFLGTRYSAGGNGPDKFDCSGFTSFVFSQFGYHLHRTSRDQYLDGTPVPNVKDLQPGDLVFYNSRSRKQNIGHVGIVVDVNPADNSFNFIHASTHAGVIIDNSKSSYYATRYASACHVLDPQETTSSKPNNPTEIIPTSPNTPTTIPASETQYHTIKKGDTLTKIAQQYHTTVDELCKLNQINRTSILQINKQIRVK